MGPPRGMRHAATARFVALNGDLGAATRRGRWAATPALQRYTKGRVLVEKLSEPSGAQAKQGNSFWRRPRQAVHDALARGPGAGTPLGIDVIKALTSCREKELPVRVLGASQFSPLLN
eukprot:7874380-Pyramimonas_sp.AAC.1